MNYMEGVAQLLGVKTGEPFNIENTKGKAHSKNPFVVDSHGLNSNGGHSSAILNSLLNGTYRIKKEDEQ